MQIMIPSSAWLWEPHFVAIAEDAKYVYYVFTEYALETSSGAQPKPPSPGKQTSQQTASPSSTPPPTGSASRYARAARVCKQDKGARAPNALWHEMWTTFRKVRLRCACDMAALLASSTPRPPPSASTSSSASTSTPTKQAGGKSRPPQRNDLPHGFNEPVDYLLNAGGGHSGAHQADTSSSSTLTFFDNLVRIVIIKDPFD